MSDQTLKAIFILNKYLTKFINVFPSHVLELFDKSISPIFAMAPKYGGLIRKKILKKFIFSVVKDF